VTKDHIAFLARRPAYDQAMHRVLIEAAGWSGAIVLLAAYVLVSLRMLRGHGAAFQVMNITGAAGVAVHSASNSAWASVALNLVWIAFGLAALARRAARSTARAVA
jgi:hypothetical protein